MGVSKIPEDHTRTGSQAIPAAGVLFGGEASARRPRAHRDGLSDGTLQVRTWTEHALIVGLGVPALRHGSTHCAVCAAGHVRQEPRAARGVSKEDEPADTDRTRSHTEIWVESC